MIDSDSTPPVLEYKSPGSDLTRTVSFWWGVVWFVVNVSVMGALVHRIMWGSWRHAQTDLASIINVALLISFLANYFVLNTCRESVRRLWEGAVWIVVMVFALLGSFAALFLAIALND
jgi:hypothetical protein